MKEKLLKKYINFEIKLKSKTAAINSTELVVLLLGGVTISLCVVFAIKKMLGDGETDDNGGVLKGFKDTFESKQN